LPSSVRVDWIGVLGSYSYSTANPHLKFILDLVLLLHPVWYLEPDPCLEICVCSPCPSIAYTVDYCRVGLEVGHENIAFVECRRQNAGQQYPIHEWCICARWECESVAVDGSAPYDECSMDVVGV
jgi:hypothetical protein